MISITPTIADVDAPSSSNANENVKGVVNRAEIFKKNKIDPESVTF